METAYDDLRSLLSGLDEAGEIIKTEAELSLTLSKDMFNLPIGCGPAVYARYFHNIPG